MRRNAVLWGRVSLASMSLALIYLVALIVTGLAATMTIIQGLPMHLLVGISVIGMMRNMRLDIDSREESAASQLAQLELLRQVDNEVQAFVSAVAAQNRGLTAHEVQSVLNYGADQLNQRLAHYRLPK